MTSAIAENPLFPPLIETVFTSLVAFLVILDPPGTAVVFIALTQAMPLAKRRMSAWMASLLAGTILLLFALTGRSWLTALGISLPAFRIAGGLLLFLLATNMVFAVHGRNGSLGAGRHHRLSLGHSADRRTGGDDLGHSVDGPG